MENCVHKELSKSSNSNDQLEQLLTYISDLVEEWTDDLRQNHKLDVNQSFD